MNKNKPIIIGLVGLPGSGKTTAAQILTKYGFKNIILSSFIKKELERKGLKVSRENLQDMGDQLRLKKGSDILAHLALAKIKRQKINKATIDGIRNLEEVKLLQKESKFNLLGLSATPDKRFQRLIKNKDKYNNLKTWDDFVHFELREDGGMKSTTGQQNKICYLQARHFIDNDTTTKNLEKKIRIMLNNF